MQKLMLILQIYPLVMQMIETNEVSVPGPGQGEVKRGLILSAIAIVYAAAPEMQKILTLAELQDLVTKIVDAIVLVKNLTGAFRKQAAAA